MRVNGNWFQKCLMRGQALTGHQLIIGLRKWNFFGTKEFFSWILISKINVKMNLRIITKTHIADSKIGSLLKSILEPIGLTSQTRQPGSSVKFISIKVLFINPLKSSLIQVWKFWALKEYAL